MASNAQPPARPVPDCTPCNLPARGARGRSTAQARGRGLGGSGAQSPPPARATQPHAFTHRHRPPTDRHTFWLVLHRVSAVHVYAHLPRTRCAHIGIWMHAHFTMKASSSVCTPLETSQLADGSDAPNLAKWDPDVPVTTAERTNKRTNEDTTERTK